MASQPQHSFAGGEWSPYVSDRVDLSKYSVSCETLENMILSVYGSVRSRPGTQYIAPAKFGDRPCRLIRFQFSETTTFVLEFGDGYIRFFSNGVQVTSGGSIYEIVSPYTDAELRDLQTCQINDEMRIVHPDHPPFLLRRLADDNWTFAEIEYSQPPLRDENLDETKTIAVSATSGTGITLTAVGHAFDENVVGGYYRIGHARENATSVTPITGTLSSLALRVKGDWEIFTSGTWEATVVLERRVAGGAWGVIRSWNGDLDRNVSATGTELDDDVELRIRVASYTSHSGAPAPRAVLEVTSSEVYAVAKVIAVASGGATATADVIVQAESTATTHLWSEGAWSPSRGYPRSITLHEARVYYGGNTAQAQTVWASDVDGYDRFTEENLQDSDSFRVTLGGTEFNAIQWLATSPKNLLVGTVGGEWSLSSGDEQNLMTGTTVRAVEESALGSEHIQAVTANDVILFVQKGGRDLNEIVYSFDQDGFINANLTELGEHVTRGGIREMSYQKNRDSILWAITGNGQLIGLTYVRKQEVVGWHRHVTQGEFESVAVISSGLEEEEIWFSIKRTINGATTRYIERFYPDMWRLHEGAENDARDLMYVDAATITTGSELTSVSLPHLENETVQVLEDGATSPDRPTSPTSVTLTNPSDTVVAGLKFTCKVKPLPLEAPMEDGTSQGREKRIHKVIISVFQTSTFKIGPSETRLDVVHSRSTANPMDAAPPLRTEKISKDFPSSWSSSVAPLIIQDSPLPLTILGLVRNYDIQGNG